MREDPFIRVREARVVSLGSDPVPAGLPGPRTKQRYWYRWCWDTGLPGTGGGFDQRSDHCRDYCGMLSIQAHISHTYLDGGMTFAQSGIKIEHAIIKWHIGIE